MEDDLSTALSSSSNIALRIHITGNSEALSSKQSLGISDDLSKEDDDVKQSSSSLSSHEVNGRPDLSEIIHKAYRETDRGRFAIVGTPAFLSSVLELVGLLSFCVACGPESFLYDVRNTVARCQLDILDGFGCKEVFLHTENYSW